MDEQHQELIAQFCGITGADANTARGALTASEWDLEAAISLHYSASDDQVHESEPQEDTEDTPTSAAPQSQASSSRPLKNSKLRTLRDLQPSANDDDEDEEKDQDMFAGGEKSGLAVQNPGSGRDHFRNILNQARQNRDRPAPVQDEEEERPSNFTGRAQTLGGDDVESRVIEDPNAARQRPQRLERITRTLHLWADGISVDDGELYRFDDPANQHIMEQINRGQAPLSLLDVQPNQEVDLTLNPHKNENYTPAKKVYKPFSGAGQRLGSPVPGPSTTTPAQPAVQTATAPAAAPSVQIDSSAPVLSLQIRLGDGSRLQSKFNSTHTIGDVYDYVAQASPSQRPYVLVTTFPTQEMSDRSQILGEINGFKRGGVLQQKYT